ncbi:hypothetical protein BCR44DRAFT_40691 [Catenaria anguillulae PL171]|uniref:Ankyrin repeat-containing domain protein n=1 Tax=Catenaria anguillulae PL171 TaxID=765915 RepID=A0A1Y2H8I4_9FUNG|nr:hypothetical protein BCR44DRAFT_40691 [Catenaria anguillulae PL171]
MRPSYGHVEVLEWLKAHMDQFVHLAPNAFRVTVTTATTPQNGVSFLASAVHFGLDAMDAWYLRHSLPTDVGLVAAKAQVTKEILLSAIAVQARTTIGTLADNDTHLVHVGELLRDAAIRKDVHVALIRGNDAGLLARWEAAFDELDFVPAVLEECGRAGRVDLLQRARNQGIRLGAHVLAAASSHGSIEVLRWWAMMRFPSKLTRNHHRIFASRM